MDKQNRWQIQFQTPETIHLGEFSTDVWSVILQFLRQRDLFATCVCHPFFYKLISRNILLKKKLSLLPRFSETQSSQFYPKRLEAQDVPNEVQHKCFSFEKSARRISLQKSPVSDVQPEGWFSNSGWSVNLAGCTAIVANVAGHEGQTVHFRLLSDFLTEHYVSYFNFSVATKTPQMVMKTPDEPESPNSDNAGKLLFHYFVDGDLWNCYYNHEKRQLARWLEKDVISIEIRKLKKDEWKLIDNDTVMTPSTATINCSVDDIPDDCYPALILTEEDQKEGNCACISLWKNYQLVHDPIIVKGVGPLWICCKFAELKDCVEIIQPEQKISLPFKESGDPPRWKSYGYV